MLCMFSVCACLGLIELLVSFSMLALNQQELVVMCHSQHASVRWWPMHRVHCHLPSVLFCKSWCFFHWMAFVSIHFALLAGHSIAANGFSQLDIWLRSDSRLSSCCLKHALKVLSSHHSWLEALGVKRADSQMIARHYSCTPICYAVYIIGSVTGHCDEHQTQRTACLQQRLSDWH